jgi:hypothetical protein
VVERRRARAGAGARAPGARGSWSGSAQGRAQGGSGARELAAGGRTVPEQERREQAVLEWVAPGELSAGRTIGAAQAREVREWARRLWRACRASWWRRVLAWRGVDAHRRGAGAGPAVRAMARCWTRSCVSCREAPVAMVEVS